MLFSDWSRAGRPDLRVSNDRFYHEDTGEEQLWRMAAAPRLYGRDDGWSRLRIWGMGIASHDLTGDGLPDYFLSNMGANRLRTLAPGSSATPRFREIAFEAGVEAKRPHAGLDERPSTAWHSQFADVNNDGWIDLFVAKGNVEEMEEAAAEDPNNLLLGGPDGSFREASAEAGVASMRRSRGAAVIDLDLDGLLDIVVVNRMANVEILHNRSRRGGHWLQLMPRQERRQPERDRRLDRGARRGPRSAPRGRGRRRPCERAGRMDPLRPRRRGDRRGSCPVARRALEPVAAHRDESLPVDRARAYSGGGASRKLTAWTTGSHART